jgi:hypothetical protein
LIRQISLSHVYAPPAMTAIERNSLRPLLATAARGSWRRKAALRRSTQYFPSSALVEHWEPRLLIAFGVEMLIVGSAPHQLSADRVAAAVALF